MNKSKSLLGGWRLATIACAAMIALLIGVRSSGVSLSQGNEEQVKNQTKAFQVVSVEQTGKSLRLRMKNTSSKGINAYSLSVGEGTSITVDYTISGYVIAPGTTEDRVVPLDETSSPSGITLEKPKINISALMFTDNTGEGDFSTVAKIRNTRRGEKSQLKRFIPLLKGVLNRVGEDLSASLDTIKSQVLALPEQAEAGEPRAVSDGLYDIKQQILRLIERLEQLDRKSSLNPADLRKELSQALKNMENRVARL